MMAGLWGAKLGALERAMAIYSFKLATASCDLWIGRDHYLFDQEFLASFIWPWAKFNVHHHAAFFCQDYKNAVPFPTEREKAKANYIGVPWVKNDTFYNRKCQIECRPKDHQEWLYC